MNLCVFSDLKKTGKEVKKRENMSQNSMQELKPLKQELKAYRARGVALFLDGKPSTPKCIAKACTFAEGGGYMRDYTEDEPGHIVRVNFDFVRDTT